MLKGFRLERFYPVLLRLRVWIMKREQFQNWVSLGFLVHRGLRAEAPVDLSFLIPTSPHPFLAMVVFVFICRQGLTKLPQVGLEAHTVA